jgi:hypothetical protein
MKSFSASGQSLSSVQALTLVDREECRSFQYAYFR